MGDFILYVIYMYSVYVLFVFHSTCYICDSRMIVYMGQLAVVEISSMTLFSEPHHPVCADSTLLLIIGD